MVLSHPYSETGVVDADVFASFTEHSHSSRLLLLNGSRVSGVWYINSMGSLRSGYSVMMVNVGSPIGILLSASNTEAIGVIFGCTGLRVDPRRCPPPSKAQLGDFGQWCHVQSGITH